MQTGTVLKGVYELDLSVTSGGQGWLWRGRDRRSGGPVAVKLFRPDKRAHEVVERRFRREIEALARLSDCPQVVTIYDFGEQDGYIYLVMEWIEGRTLREVLTEAPQPWLGRVVSWGGQLCSGLAHAHRNGVVHRDIKPTNIMVRDSGDITLIDFGIARFTDSTVTEGTAVGSSPYMAPERWRDEAGDHRTDLYAVGCVLYEMLTGDSPFQGPQREYKPRHLYSMPVPPGRRLHGIPQRLDDLVIRLLAKDPARRPADAAEVARLLAFSLDVSETISKRIDQTGEEIRRLSIDHGPADPRTFEASMLRAELIARSGDISGAAREYDRIIAEYERLSGPFDERVQRAREAMFRLIASGT